MFVVFVAKKRRSFSISCALITSLCVEFKKLGVLEATSLRTMGLSLCNMALKRNVARKAESLAALLLFSALKQRRLGFQLVRRSDLHFGDRTLAVKLDIPDARKRVVKIFFLVAHFPIGAASAHVRQAFYSQFEQCISSCSADEVLLVAADTNSSMGIRSSVRDGVLGPFGVEYCNKAGKELYDCCATLGLFSATTFFRKPQYQTWKNPRSKLGHQIDHCLVRRSVFARVRDAGRYGGLAVESDHQPLSLFGSQCEWRKI